MLTSIDVEWVSAVLLGDGWHIVQPGTFRVGDYDFAVAPGDAPAPPPLKGYHFIKIDQLTRRMQHYAGPLNYVLGVRYDVPTELVLEGAPDAE